jgi:hypothetical protein
MVSRPLSVSNETRCGIEYLVVVGEHLPPGALARGPEASTDAEVERVKRVRR